MEPAFDPYYKWLGIPPEQQPPDYYRLLGIEAFESDPDVIQSAADQRMAHLRNYQTGPHSDHSQRLLNEVASARVCLLNVAKKALYDGQLQAILREKSEEEQEEYALASPVPSGADALDELPYGRRPRAAIRRSSTGFGSRVPVAAVLGGLAIVGGLVMVGMYLQGNPGWLGTTAEGTAKIVKPGNDAEAKRAKRSDKSIAKKGPIEMPEPPPPVVQPTEVVVPAPSETLPAQPAPPPETVSKAPQAVEEYLPDQTEPILSPPDTELPASKMRNLLPPENVQPANPSHAEQTSAEQKAAEQKAAEQKAAAATPRLRFRFNKWFDLLTSRNELLDWEVGDAHYSYADRLIELEDGCMFCPIVAKDAMIRATVRRSSSGAFVYLLLRNSDEGCYAAALEDRTVRIFRMKQPPGANSTRPVWQRRTRDMLGEFTLPKSNTYVATAVFQFGFSAVGNILAAYINTDVPLLAVKDNSFAEGSVGIGVRNNSRGYFTDVELRIPNKQAFVADLRPLPTSAKSSGSSDPKTLPAK